MQRMLCIVDPHGDRSCGGTTNTRTRRAAQFGEILPMDLRGKSCVIHKPLTNLYFVTHRLIGITPLCDRPNNLSAKRREYFASYTAKKGATASPHLSSFFCHAEKELDEVMKVL